jgi:hypothetical protein
MIVLNRMLAEDHAHAARIDALEAAQEANQAAAHDDSVGGGTNTDQDIDRAGAAQREPAQRDCGGRTTPNSPNASAVNDHH